MPTPIRVRVFRGIHTGVEGRVVNYDPRARRQLTIEVDGSVSDGPIYVDKAIAELAGTVIATAI